MKQAPHRPLPIAIPALAEDLEGWPRRRHRPTLSWVTPAPQAAESAERDDPTPDA